jgi:integrase
VTRLSKSFIDKLPIPLSTDGKTKQAFYRDSALPGFGLRVTSGGSKSFIVEKRINGRVKRLTVGKYGPLTPEKARSKAIELLGDITVGKDPIAEKRAISAKKVTLQEAFESYQKSRKDLKPGTIKNYEKCVDGCLADWKNRPLTAISKDMVEARHYEIGQRAPARANNTMRVLRAIFNHAMEKYEDGQGEPIIRTNPIDRLRRNRAWYRVERRTGVIKQHQLKAWNDAVEQLTLDVTRDFLLFLLFTGLRKMEAAKLRWQDVDLIDRTFTIPDTKNREKHVLPLPNYLFELLTKRKDAATKGEVWVFPSPQHDTHFKEPRHAIKQVTELSGVTFTLHDLRRTFITIAESLDIPAYALKRLLNHRNPSDVTAGYIVADVERLRNPMEKTATHIHTLMTYVKQDVNANG